MEETLVWEGEREGGGGGGGGGEEKIPAHPPHEMVTEGALQFMNKSYCKELL